jgi:hypothetical protein
MIFNVIRMWVLVSFAVGAMWCAFVWVSRRLRPSADGNSVDNEPPFADLASGTNLDRERSPIVQG